MGQQTRWLARLGQCWGAQHERDLQQNVGLGGRKVCLRCSTILWTKFAMLMGSKRCRMQQCRGSLQSALRFSAWIHWERCQTGHLQGGSRGPARPGGKMADGSAPLTGSDLEAWRDWRRILLRSPSELQEVIALEGRVAPHTDTELKRKPRCYARLVRDMSLRGLVSFGPPAQATVGVFVVPKKKYKQRLIFDTRRVNQHFRRPWHCALATPSSWAGLQRPAISAYHMAQTDVNTAFYRILAPDGMSEYFILPGVSTQLLL